jgi:hypothetical protein
MRHLHRVYKINLSKGHPCSKCNARVSHAAVVKPSLKHFYVPCGHSTDWVSYEQLTHEEIAVAMLMLEGL